MSKNTLFYKILGLVSFLKMESNLNSSTNSSSNSFSSNLEASPNSPANSNHFEKFITNNHYIIIKNKESDKPNESKECRKCKYCETTYKMSTGLTNLQYHLTRKHGLTFGKSETKIQLSKEERYEIDSALMFCLIFCFLPFSIVENKYFKNFVSKINTHTDYTLPCRKTLNILLEEIYEQYKDKLSSYLQGIKWIHATTDTWTSCQNYNYLSVTIHFFNNLFKKKYIALCLKHFIGEHSAENLKLELEGIIDDFQLNNKIVSISSDNASNIQNALELLQVSNTIIETGRCFGHMLQLIVNRVIESLSNVGNTKKLETYRKSLRCVISKCKNIATSFNHSTQLTAELENKQKNENPDETPLRIVQEVATRWHSLFLCLKRIKLLHGFISEIFHSNIKHKKLRENLLTPDQEVLLTEAIDILQHFDNATEMISGETYVTCALTLPLFKFLQNACKPNQKDSDFSSFLKKDLMDSMSFYSDKNEIENSQMLMACSFLHPVYKHLPFVEKEDRVKTLQNVKIKNNCTLSKILLFNTF